MNPVFLTGIAPNAVPPTAIHAARQLLAAYVRWQTTRQDAQRLIDAARQQEQVYRAAIGVLQGACQSEEQFQQLFEASITEAAADVKKAGAS